MDKIVFGVILILLLLLVSILLSGCSFSVEAGIKATGAMGKQEIEIMIPGPVTDSINLPPPEQSDRFGYITTLGN